MNLDNKKLIGLGLVLFLVMQNSNGGKPDSKPTATIAGVKIAEPEETYEIVPKISEVMVGDTAKHDARVLAYMMYHVGKLLKEDGELEEPRYRTKEQAMDLLNRGKMSSMLKGSYKLGDILIPVCEDLELQVNGPLNAEARADFVSVAEAFAWAFYSAAN